MIIREYRQSDCGEMAKLFYNTVHRVNSKDYTKEQIDVWATGNIDLEKWDVSFREHYTLVAVEDSIIVGFGDITADGYLDRLYVHADYQGQGVATAICDKLEEYISGDITTHASITAKPFFEGRGYVTVKKQEVVRSGVVLENFVMKKEKTK